MCWRVKEQKSSSGCGRAKNKCEGASQRPNPFREARYSKDVNLHYGISTSKLFKVFYWRVIQYIPAKIVQPCFTFKVDATLSSNIRYQHNNLSMVHNNSAASIVDNGRPPLHANFPPGDTKFERLKHEIRMTFIDFIHVLRGRVSRGIDRDSSDIHDLKTPSLFAR